MTQTENMYRELGISPAVYAFGQEIEKSLKERFDRIDETAEYNQLKVVGAMQKNRVEAACFAATSGYGYNDLGRDKLEEVYAAAFHAEAALVRPQIACGTHALAVALSGNLRPGDELLSPVGKPYDTLEEVIGIRPSNGSLAEYGVTYRQVDLKEDGSFDYPAIEAALNERTKLVTIQRSKGYQTRPTPFCTADRRVDCIYKRKKAGCDLHGGQLLWRVCRTDRAHGCRRGSLRRLSHQEPGRRPGSYRWLHRGKRTVCGKRGIPSDFSGPRQGSGRVPGRYDQLLSGIFPGSDGHGRQP